MHDGTDDPTATTADSTPLAVDLRTIVDTYEQTQRMRIQLGNRVKAVARGVDEEATEGFLSSAIHNLADRLEESEKELVAEMHSLLRDHPAWPWLREVRGVGPTLAGKVVGLIGDISLANTVSALWRFAGYAVIDGQREKLVKGEKAHFNRRLKTACYLVGTSFLKTGSPYREFYDKARERYAVTHGKDTEEPWTEGHCHNAAMRYMVKMFLSHLWQVWRTAEGLPVREPWAHEYAGHTSAPIDPWKYATKGKGKKAAA